MTTADMTLSSEPAEVEQSFASSGNKSEIGTSHLKSQSLFHYPENVFGNKAHFTKGLWRLNEIIYKGEPYNFMSPFGMVYTIWFFT